MRKQVLSVVSSGCLLLFALLPACAALKSNSADSSAQPVTTTEPSTSAPSEAKTAHMLSATHIAREIYIGQAYPSGAVYLDVLDDREAGTKRWPKTIKIYPLLSDADATGAPLPATLIGPMERVYPPEVENLGEKSPECSAHGYKQDPVFGYAHKTTEAEIRDYFDRVASDNCSTYDVAKYWTSQKVNVSFPVFAVGEVEVSGADYSIGGKPRPLSMAEREKCRSSIWMMRTRPRRASLTIWKPPKKSSLFRLPSTGWSARISTLINERGDQRNRLYVLDILEKAKVKKRHIRTLFKGAL